MTKFLLNILTLILPAMLGGMLLAACDAAEEPSVMASGDVSLTLDISTADIFPSRASSRASSRAYQEVDSEYGFFEDGIDLSDLAIFLFASVDGVEGEEVLVLKCTDLSSATNVLVIGSPGHYVANIDLTRQQLHAALNNPLAGLDSPIEISPEGTQRISLRVLMLANSSSPGTNAQAKWDRIDGVTYSDVISQLGDWTYAMSYLYNGNVESDDVQDLYSNRKRNCPMFGTYRYGVTQRDLCASRPESRLNVGSVFMLRSLAKIRVEDGIAKDASGYPKVIAAEFVGSQDMARQLPHGALLYANASQVTQPNVAAPGNPLNPENPHVYRLGVIPDKWSVSEPAVAGGKIRVGYVPEQDIAVVSGDTYLGRPLVRVKVAFSDDPDGDKLYEIPMTSYNGQVFDFGNAILRNHIYTFSVWMAFEGTLLMKAEVKPYTVVTLDPIFGLDRP